MGDTTYFQIGEVKYGKPILDRIIHHDTSLSDAAKCAAGSDPEIKQEIILHADGASSGHSYID